MSEPFLAEIRMVGFNFAPRGWAECDGQLLPISQNQSLFSLLGTMYGGDGRTTFALPELRGRTPVHVGTADTLPVSQGQRNGAQTHTLSVNELPTHNHSVTTTGDQGSDTNITGETNMPNNVLASQARRGVSIYADADAGNLIPMHNATIANTGGGQSQNNMQPYLAVNFTIALQGLFPSRS